MGYMQPRLDRTTTITTTTTTTTTMGEGKVSLLIKQSLLIFPCYKYLLPLYTPYHTTYSQSIFGGIGGAISGIGDGGHISGISSGGAINGGGEGGDGNR